MPARIKDILGISILHFFANLPGLPAAAQKHAGLTENGEGFGDLDGEKTATLMFTPLSLTELLTEAQIETLHAAVDRIIPADAAPSGWEAGVGGYFAQLLTRESRFLFTYRQGLDALDAEARLTEGAAFAALGPFTQDSLLLHVESGQVRDEWPVAPRAFFRRLVEQTMEGFYADPGNGGNKDGVAWDMIGFRVTA